jgi:hypothetical protein
MANRDLKPAPGNLEQGVVQLFGSFLVGASGAVTSGSVKGGGISTVVKEATAGQYTVTLSDRWNRLLKADAKVVLATIAAALPQAQILMAPSTLQSGFKADGKIVIQFVDAAGAAVNPDSGAMVMMDMIVRNSSVGPWDN